MAHGHGQGYWPEYARYCSPVTNVSLSGSRPEQLTFPAHVPSKFLTECPDLAFRESGPRSGWEYGQDMLPVPVESLTVTRLVTGDHHNPFPAYIPVREMGH